MAATKERDHRMTDEIICPWCFSDNDSADFSGDAARWECCNCGKPFDVSADYFTLYTTSKPHDQSDSSPPA